MKRGLLALALAGCAFEPVYLDAEATLDGVDEVAGVVPDGDGFALAGSRFDDDGEARTAVVLGAAADGAVMSVDAHRLERASGLVVLPGGDRLVYGHSSGARAMRVGPDRTEAWSGAVGSGQTVRAGLLAGGGVALAGAAHVQVDGSSRNALWFALLDPDAGPSPVAEDAWLPPGAIDASAWAVLARPGGGFLVGGSATVAYGEPERPWLLAVTGEGRIERENLFPDAEMARGRVGALALAGDRVAVAGEDGGNRAFVRLLGTDGRWATPARPLCAGGVAPTRPVALVALDDGFAAAGWRGWEARDLWLARFDAEGRTTWLRTFGPLTDGGADRVALARSAAGGLALAATRCADATCDGPGGAPRLWHLDTDGGPYGTAEEAMCPD